MRLYTRNGSDFGKRFPLIVAAVAVLPVHSCLIDREAIVSDETGLAVFELLRSWRHDHAAALCAFELLDLDGPIMVRPEWTRKRSSGSLQALEQNEFGKLLPAADAQQHSEAEEDWS